jgi:endoglucanase
MADIAGTLREAPMTKTTCDVFSAGANAGNSGEAVSDASDRTGSLASSTCKAGNVRRSKLARLLALVTVAVTACGVSGTLPREYTDKPGPTTPAPERFYADPDSLAAAWVRSHPDDPMAAEIQADIAAQPAARWFGDGSGDIGPAVSRYVAAAKAMRRTPILVAYDIPLRDCGQYSKGGAASMYAYRQWISAFAAGIGASQAVVVVEPDALAQLDCLSAQAQSDRLDLLRYAAAQFKGQAPNARVYLDIGHSGWLSTTVAASRLAAAGVADVRGFSLNVSNFKTTVDSASYGRSIAALLAQEGLAKTFLVDTSRNGNGPLASQWCDPPGRRLGEEAMAYADGGVPEMTLWIKNPGRADGCAAAAGTFVPHLADRLIHGT